MTSNGAAGFWSYTHRDDEIEGGRIRRLAQNIANEFEGITAEELHVFLDKQDLKWGDEWRNRIDNALTGSTFFMPIVTPRFFRSEECRREILTFSGHAKSLGLEELLLPILYFDVPQLKEGDVTDEVMALVAQRQYEDWTQLRLEDEGSPSYRKRVNRLAVRLVEILERTAEIEPPPVVLVEAPDADDDPGLIELMADAEMALPRWAAVVAEIGVIIERIGEHVKGAAMEMEESDGRGGGFAGRLRVIHELTNSLREPVGKLTELGNQYSAELVTVDPGVLGIIRLVESQGISDSDRADTEEFFGTVKTLAQQSQQSMANVQAFSDTLPQIAGLSKSMRPLLRQMRSALQQVTDGQAVLDEWERRIDEVTAAWGE
ncbi:toll/interleukin-1 receptor domain-containing protein [Streptomyces sp. 3213.3]|uniref:toll/interleukin-1 receptor domain-containing protein n=1 Tax=Streptomyces sp. 3213.3 TaxID=1855348 RepID=UPI00135A35CB|nr:toll/interleukin-1 receptor domain-containing protein [Streptomyces sp. 3213.3]